MYHLKTAALTVLLCFSFFFNTIPVDAQAQVTRSFNELFPGLNETQKSEIFSKDGFINTIKKNEAPQLVPAKGSGIDLLGEIMKTDPSYLTESLLVVPYSGRPLNKLDAYNAVRKISDLNGRVYHSFTRKADVPLFEEATRLESERRNRTIPDPPPATVLPSSETVYIRLKDANFGNSYYRGNISTSLYGLNYHLTNNRNLTYFLIPVMKEEKFSAILYMEPLSEGMLVYSMAGADTSDFIASKVDIPSAISKRLAVFIDWISDGIKSVR